MKVSDRDQNINKVRNGCVFMNSNMNEPGKDLCENLCVVTVEPALQTESRSKSSSPVSQGLSTDTGDFLES